MVGQPQLSINLKNINPSAIVTDIVYIPLKTDLIAQAEKLGLRTVPGLGMLLHQAVIGFQKWFDILPKVTPELRQILEDDIRRGQRS